MDRLSNPPVLTLDPAILDALGQLDVGHDRAEALHAWFRERLRVTYDIQMERVAEAPLRVGTLGRLLGRRPTRPSLPLTASKLGGSPYVPDPTRQWPRGKDKRLPFLAQINFADVPPDSLLPSRGILVLFLPHKWYGPGSAPSLWFPDVDETLETVDDADAAPIVIPYEHRLTFDRDQTLDTDDGWESLFGDVEDIGMLDPLREAVAEWQGELWSDGGLLPRASAHYGGGGEPPDYPARCLAHIWSEGFGYGHFCWHLDPDDLRRGRFDTLRFEFFKG